MTDLTIRNLPFRFDETVPFQWNRANPEFGVLANAIGLLIISMEKMIVSVSRRALERITDPAVIAETQAFLRQEAIHSRAHQLHMRVLVARHPGLASTMDAVDASFRALERERSLEYLVAYIAALEGTFPPFFKMVLDHRDSLLANGDARVASLFAWHFVEEIEHRASATILYDAIVPEPTYRVRVMGPAFAHAVGLLGDILEDFAVHVPLEDSLVDPRRLLPRRSLALEIRGRLPFVRRARDRHPSAFHAIPPNDLVAMFVGLVRSQWPGHDPAHEPVPDYASTWMADHARGVEMTRYLGVEPGVAS